MRGFETRVRLFEHEPDLLAWVDPRQRDAATQITVPLIGGPERGEWSYESVLRSDQRTFGVLVLDGLMHRVTTIGGWRAVELLGPGDVLRPIEGLDWQSIQYGGRFYVDAPQTRLAHLDAEFEGRLCQLPGVAGILLGRGIHRARTLAVQLAISRIRPVELRVLTLLWHLADRWGRRGGEGTELSLPLTHSLLADLICVERPTASRAVASLRAAGRIAPGGRRAWLLLGDPPQSQELSQS
jgi:CRP-like cAMP-binding protein